MNNAPRGPVKLPKLFVCTFTSHKQKYVTVFAAVNAWDIDPFLTNQDAKDINIVPLEIEHSTADKYPIFLSVDKV